MNFLQETEAAIQESGHTTEQIKFIGSEKSGHRCTWDEFCSLADFEYDEGYGSQKVASDLIIVFTDGGMMQRREYDGSEGWDFQRKFVMPRKVKQIKSLSVGDGPGWRTLEELNK